MKGGVRDVDQRDEEGLRCLLIPNFMVFQTGKVHLLGYGRLRTVHFHLPSPQGGVQLSEVVIRPRAFGDGKRSQCGAPYTFGSRLDFQGKSLSRFSAILRHDGGTAFRPSTLLGFI